MATISEIQATSIALTNNILTSLEADVKNLINKSYEIGALTPSIPDVNLALIDLSGGLTSTSTSINLPDLVSYNSVEIPEAAELSSISTPSVPSVPEFADSAPTINIPAIPSNTLPAAPGNSPEFFAPSIPGKPDVFLPSVPSLVSIEIPAVPMIDLPSFEGVMPVDELTEPVTSFDFVEHNYSSELLSHLNGAILGDLKNGGYGIEPSDEIALWERARERELKAADSAIEEATAQIASRGFVLPPGALFNVQQIAEQDALDKSATLSREIMLKRADLYVQNRQFAITHAKEIEAMLIQYNGARAERALNAAKAQVDVGVSLYNLRVQKFQAFLEGYRTQAQVYETRIRANLVALESFKAQIEGVRAAVDVQSLQVNVYRTQVEAANIAISLYRTEMEAAQIQASIEKLKLEAFRASVDAYTAQVGAREAEFKMFEAQIRGEVTKIDAYKASADAYSSRVGAIKVRVEAEDLIARSQIAANESKLSQYRAQIDGYRATLEKINSENRSILEQSGLYAELEKVLDSKEQTRKQTVFAVSKANSEIYAEAAKLGLQRSQALLQGFIQIQQLSKSGIEAGVKAKADIAAASLGVVNSVISKNEA